MRINYVLSKIHLSLGLISGLCIFVVAISGSILVFRDSLESTLYPQIYKLSPQDYSITLDSIVMLAKQNLGDKWSYIEISHNKARPILINYKIHGKQDFLAINPYTGQILSKSINEDNFFPWLLRLHRYLLLGKTGKTITGISALCFLSLLITGIILWWKNKVKKIPNNLYYNIHTIGGLFIYPVAMVIILTGLCFAYKNVRSSLYYIFDAQAKQKQQFVASELSSTIDYQAILRQIPRELPLPIGDLRVYAPDKNAVIKVRENKYLGKIQYVRNMLYFDTHSKLISKQLFSGSSTAEKINRSIYAVHTGLFFATWSKVLYFLVALIIAVLPITGIILYFRRKNYKKMQSTKEFA